MKKNLPILIASILFSIVLWASVSLSNEYFATYKIPLDIADFPDGYNTGTNIPEEVSVKLRGNGWKLISVNLGADPVYQISAEGDSGRKTANLFNYLADNQWLSTDIEVMDIYPDTISYYVERIISKQVKINPILNLSFKPGYGLASPVKVIPDSAFIYGPYSYVNSLSSLPTEIIKIENIDERTVEKVNLQNLQGMSYETSSVSVIFDVQRIVDKTFAGLPVEVRDIPADRDVVLLPNKVDVGLKGGIDILGKIDPASIQLYVDYRDVVLDTLGSVTPKIVLPENTGVMFIKPDNLRYVIKKFN